jgi:MoxR-like ATPase
MEERALNVTEFGQQMKGEIRKIFFGQNEVVDHVLICLLSGGHALLEGVPGIAKTLLARTVSVLTGCEFKRVQFTPDLMPSDVLGTNVYDMQQAAFHLRKGPIFTNVLLADEINRTPPKTQSALLQAMEERVVTIDGVDYTLDGIFFVIATQNPVEYEGTYPLPEAQLDRFFMKILLSYPQEAEERQIVQSHHRGFDPQLLSASGITPLVDVAQLKSLQKQIVAVKVEEGVIGYILQIVRRTRGAFQLTLGASPRASIALLKGAKALAALRGRDFVIPDDVKTLALPILRHRVIVTPEAEIEGVTSDQVIQTLLAGIEVPR